MHAYVSLAKGEDVTAEENSFPPSGDQPFLLFHPCVFIWSLNSSHVIPPSPGHSLRLLSSLSWQTHCAFCWPCFGKSRVLLCCCTEQLSELLAQSRDASTCAGSSHAGSELFFHSPSRKTSEDKVHLHWHFSGLELRVNQEIRFKQKTSFAGFLLVNVKKTEQHFLEGSASGTMASTVACSVVFYFYFFQSIMPSCVFFLNQHYKAEVCVPVGLCHSPFLL